jgi:PDZ domain-containing protein
MSRRGATLGVSVALAVGLGVGGAQLRVPYVGLGPGPVFNTLGASNGKQLIEIAPGHDHPASGELDLTTVNVYPDLRLGEAVAKWFDHRFAVVPRDVIYPPGQSVQQSEAETRREMRESQQHAVTAALCELGTPATARVVVDAVGDGSGAAKAGLAKDDRITAIDGKPVDSVCTLRKVMAAHRAGDVVRVTYVRAGATHTADVKTSAGEGDNAGRALLGVGLTEQDPKPPFAITIALNDVGGPSAGLMFALGIYDRLTEGDLTGDHVIAGTGTIDDDGSVGPIGGIQQKLIAARAHGATYFLTPAGNYDEARKAVPHGMVLVRITSLHEGLAAVRAIAAGHDPNAG